MTVESDSTPALLLIDVLGTRAVWAKDGSEGAVNLFERLASLVREELSDNYPGTVLSGGVESDCAALICKSADAAVSVGIGIYERAFFRPKSARLDRLWLRGVIIPLEGPADVQWLRTAAPLDKDLPQVAVVTYGESLLDAISLEKAGFKGMRLLLDPRLDSPGLRNANRLSIGEFQRTLVPFRHMENSDYGSRLDDFLDVLWMAEADPEVWQDRRQRMSSRMRFSARVPAEVLQAAATQVVFDECDSIIRSLSRQPAKRVAKQVAPGA